MRSINIASAASAAIGLSLIAAALFFGATVQDVAGVLPRIPFGSSAEAEEFRLSDSEALARASSAAQEQLDQSVGRDREVGGTRVPAVRVRVEEMRLVDQTFRGHASSFTSIAGSHDLGGGADVWTFEWELRGLSVPELQMPDAVLRVVIAIEDGTGKVRMVRVSTVNAIYAAR
ncbi:hypothetical protein [Candidatus Amarobacter glycogenicus]|uniref:hypothetical protein n=1 Tax=Candidatus Amarobacter glycogenicus TaxID=3140699 RepID=UPI002A13DA0E|nr:hypothetical protein [Dehalococcoidia bacterium]MBK9611031.1 hypothetical protein [Dehalococcoidia bacterium]